MLVWKNIAGERYLEFTLRMPCVQCQKKISLPFQPRSPLPWISCCPECGHQFGIDCEEMSRQITLFIDLCEQIQKSEEILSNASIAITVGNKEVKVPFKLLLTRLKSTFDLEVDGKKISVSTRTETVTAQKE